MTGNRFRGWSIATVIAFAVVVIAGVASMFTVAMPAFSGGAVAVAAVFAIVTVVCLVGAVITRPVKS